MMGSDISRPSVMMMKIVVVLYHIIYSRVIVRVLGKKKTLCDDDKVSSSGTSVRSNWCGGCGMWAIRGRHLLGGRDWNCAPSWWSDDASRRASGVTDFNCKLLWRALLVTLWRASGEWLGGCGPAARRPLASWWRWIVRSIKPWLGRLWTSGPRRPMAPTRAAPISGGPPTCSTGHSSCDVITSPWPGILKNGDPN